MLTNIYSDTIQFIIVLLSIWKICNGETYYCQNGVTVAINVTAESTATIITRLQGTALYDNDLNCKWQIYATENGSSQKRLNVKVISSDLDYAPDGSNCNSYDFVAVKEDHYTDDIEYYDWNNADVGRYFTWCGSSNPRYFSSQDQDLVIEFTTNDRNTYDQTGVKLEITAFDVGDCPPEWESETERDTEYCYKLRTHEETWADAQDYCNKEQANLVSFKDNTEATFVTEMIQNAENINLRENIWIGLNDISENGDYRWIDEIASSASSRWRSSPHDADVYDNCVSVQYEDGLWQEQYCTESEIQTTTKNKFVCKTRKDFPTKIFDLPSEKNSDEPEQVDGSKFTTIVIGCACGLLVVVIILAVFLCIIFQKKPTARRRRKRQTERRGSDTELSLNPVIPPRERQDRSQNDQGVSGSVTANVLISNQRSVEPTAPPVYEPEGRHSPPPPYTEAVKL